MIEGFTDKSGIANPLDIMIHAVSAETAIANINITFPTKIFCVLVNHPGMVVFVFFDLHLRHSGKAWQ